MATGTLTTKSVRAVIHLNNGTKSDGTLATVGVSLGTLDPEGYDKDKVATVITYLKDSFSKGYVKTMVTTSQQMTLGV